MSKIAIREQVLTSLKELSLKNEKQQQENNILDKFYQDDLWKNSQVIGITLSMSLEFDTNPLIKKALEEGKRIVIPKTYPNGLMDFHHYDLKEPLKRSSFGVLEPINSQRIPNDEIDLLIVPGVGFTLDGHRVGFGGGYYDRYLANFKGKTCSFVFNEQLIPTFSPEKFDVAVDCLFTADSTEEVEK